MTASTPSVSPVCGNVKMAVRDLNFYYGKFHALHTPSVPSDWWR